MRRPPPSAAPSDPAPRALRLALGAALVILVGVAFAPAFSAEFLNFDDDKLLTLHHAWRGLGTGHLRWMLTTCHMGHYQPLTWLSFGADYVLHGLTGPRFPEAGAYHATSVALHTLGTLAFFGLGQALLAIATPALDGTRRTLAAALAAALWAVHPLRVESVVWLTERRDVVSGVFFVLAIWAWLGWARSGVPASRPLRVDLAVGPCALASLACLWWAVDLSSPVALAIASWPALVVGVGAWLLSAALVARGSGATWALALCGACMVLSLLAKAWAIVLPGLLLVLDGWPLRRWSPARWHTLAVEKLPLVVPALAFARLAHWAQASAVGVMKTWDEHPLEARLAQSFYGLAYYPLKTVVPSGLLPIYELPKAMTFDQPRWLLAALAVLAAAGLVVALRVRVPALLAAALCYLVLVSPVLGLWQSGPQLVADRYGYLAGMPLALLAGGAAVSLAGARTGTVGALAAAALLVSTAATCQQATVWRTSASLWEHAHALAPQSPMILTSLGALRAREADGDPEPGRALSRLHEAVVLYERALAVDQDPLVLRNLSQVRTTMSLLDRTHAAEHKRDALAYSTRALVLARERNVLTPEYGLAYGTDLVNVGRLDEGLAQLEAYVRARPDRLRGLVNLGGALIVAGRAADALPYLERACRLEPTDARGWSMLGRAYETLGRTAEARAAWQQARALAPADAEAAQRARALEAIP